MQLAKKGMLVISAPLALAAMLGGAVAFASQSGGAESAPARTLSNGHHSLTQTRSGDGQDGTDCPYGKGAGATGDGAVSPAVY